MNVLVRTVFGLVKLLAGLAIVAAALIAILPWLLSMSGTRAALLSLVNSTSRQQIAIEEASLSWGGPQRLKGVFIEDKSRNTTVRCEQITTDATLWQMLSGDHDIGYLTVQAPYVLVQTEQLLPSAPQLIPSGPTLANLAPVQDFCSLGARATGHFVGQVEIQNGTLEIAGPHIDNVFFNAVTVEAKLPQKGESLSFQFHGDTVQKETKGHFSFAGTLLPCEGQEAILVLNGSATHLPVLGLDQMLTLAQPPLRGVALAALGSTLDLTLSSTLSQNQCEFSLELTSPQAKAALQATTEGGHIVLRTPARCSLAVTPALAEYLFSLSPELRGFGLASGCQLLATLDTLDIPLQGSTVDWQKLGMKAQLQLTDVHFQTPLQLRGLSLDQIQTSLSTQELQKDLSMDTRVNLHYAEASSSFISSLQIASPLQKPTVHTFSLQTDRFPTVIADQLLAQKGGLVEALGETVNLHAEVAPGTQGSTATLSLSSPHLALKKASFTLQPLQLQEPVEVLFTPSAAWVRRYLPDAALTPVKVTVKDFTMGPSPYTMKAHAELSTDVLTVKKTPLTHPNVQIAVNGWNDIALHLQADGVTGECMVGYDPLRKLIAFKEPLHLHLELTPAAWSSLASNWSTPTQLLNPASLEIQVHPFSLPLETAAMVIPSLEGTLQLNNFALNHPGKPKSRLALQNVAINWKTVGADGELIVQGRGQIAGDSETWSDFQMDGTVKGGNISGRFLAPKLDSSAFDVWTGGSSSLAPLLGSPLSVKVEVAHSPEENALSLFAKSDRLQLEAALSCNQEQLSLRSPRQNILCNWTISPEGFAVAADLWRQTFNEEIPLRLAETSQLTMRIDALALPMKDKCLTLAPDALASALFSGTFSIERLPLVENKTQAAITLQHLEMQVQRQQPGSPLNFHLKTTIDAAKPGLADLRGSVESAAAPGQAWDPSHLHVKLEGNFQDLPTTLPDLAGTLVGAKPRTFSMIFGPSLTGSVKADVTAWNGPLSLKINTPGTRVSFNGLLSAGVLTLQDPLIAQVTMTKELSSWLMEISNPLSLDVVTSEGPMTLTVPQEGFSLPVRSWDLGTAAIPQARIDLGKITCHNKGNINVMLGLLKFGKFSSEKDLTLWFAPLDISLQKGIIDCSRTEILVSDQLDIATWGTIDLMQDRVDAVLGLTAQTLKVAFGITNLPSDYVMQLPMRGSIGNVKIDTGKATAKIAMLLAWQKTTSPSGGFLGGSKGGALVGGLLGQLAQLPDASASAPPAKHPFPWETQSENQPSKKKKKRKAAIKPGDKPLKQLIKLFH